MSMDIYSKPGVVVYYLGENGYDGDREYANQYMRKGLAFTVKTISIGTWRTDVEFEEIPGKWFNSVMFEEVKKVKYTDDDIKWIKQYRVDNECGLQGAKRALLLTRIQYKIDNKDITSRAVLQEVLYEMLELMK
jgi:hypothetical protein